MNKYGIPCSNLKVEEECIPVTSEIEAIAIAAGTYLAGKEPSVYMQNTGLLRIVEVILTLHKPYEIPLPHLILSMRKTPYHHSFVYSATEKIIELLEWKNIERIEEK